MKKTTKKKTATLVGKYVVLATTSRPWTIAAGTVTSDTADGVVLGDARMCVYYGAASRGAFGLASGGPSASARVSGAVPEVTFARGAVEWIAAATPEARAAWESEPWS